MLMNALVDEEVELSRSRGRRFSPDRMMASSSAIGKCVKIKGLKDRESVIRRPT